METIAITFWNGVISPLFDVAAQALIVNNDKRFLIRMNNTTIHEKAELLHKYKTNVVICGAISSMALTVLQGYKIRVIPWICGEIENVLTAYKSNSLETGHFFMPGCNRRRHCHRNRKRNDRYNQCNRFFQWR
jgi:predicted Fe-Mo cluster-binding NifX family protein